MASAHKATFNKSEFYLGHIQSWEQSGMSQERYCQSVNIAYPAFVYWRTKFLDKNKKVPSKEKQKFIPVVTSSVVEAIKLPGTEKTEDKKITVILPNGIQLCFPLSINPTSLGDYIRAIRVSS